MPGIIDDRRWIAARLKFLRERLVTGPSDEERAAIEAEIEALSAQRHRMVLGWPRGMLRLSRRRRTDG